MRQKVTTFLLLLGGILMFNLGTAASQGALKVVATHSILADVARNVAGDLANISSLIPVGADSHAFIPTPRDLTAVAKADLVFINGAGFEENLLEAVANAGESVAVVDVSACIDILPFGAASHVDDEHALEHDEMVKPSDCDEHDAEFARLVGEEDHGAHHLASLGRGQDIDCSFEVFTDDHGHAHGACDPHVWMDPHNVIYWVLTIRDTLSAADPVNAAAYGAKAAAYAQDLVALETEFILPLLADLPPAQRVLITSHESLGYFATTFDFEVITSVVPGMATAVEPSARDIANLIETIRAEAVPAIFGDTLASASIMQTVAEEAGVDLVGLYSDTLSESAGPAATYLDYMRYNVAAIVAALSDD